MSTTRIANHKAKLYKTSHYTPEQIASMEQRAEGQEKKIARYYCKNPHKAIGPSQLHKIFFPDAPTVQKWDLNSTRRSITNLTEDDILVKTKKRGKTYRGGTEHKWRWKWPKDFDKAPKQIDAFGKPETKNRTYSI